MKKQASIGILEHMQTCTEPMDASKQFCPNEACSARGQKAQGNIIIHDRKRQRYRCKVCKGTFSARRGTMFEGLRKPDRPWLSAILDDHSRAIAGYFLGFQAPTALQTALTLLEGILHINEIRMVTKEVVEAAREQLVIGQV